MKRSIYFFLFSFLLLFSACKENPKELWAEDILGNPANKAISFGGYREETRERVPSVEDLKEDMTILHAIGVRIIRTYNTQQFEQAANVLKAIRELKTEDPSFEMYVMLGAWIDCKGAWGDEPDHSSEDPINNEAEINAAVKMAQDYPDIVKIIAVGNEAMVHWATSYYVQPAVILKWVEYLQELKDSGDLHQNLWITSSDNFASWGGADNSYHNEDLTALMQAVDYISMHTYPFHDTHYNPSFWGVPAQEEGLSKEEQIEAAMERASQYAKGQYEAVVAYMQSLNIYKEVHIGETGWATKSNSFYGLDGSRAADEYKQKLYHDKVRTWTQDLGIACFYFEAFDEKWKDPTHPDGSENHFGLINLQGEAKYVLWNEVDMGTFKDLKRNGKAITKTYNGNETLLFDEIGSAPFTAKMGTLSINTVNEKRNAGDPVTESIYVISSNNLDPENNIDMCYPSAPLKLNPWEGSCAIEMDKDGHIHIETGSADWWGCGLEIEANGFGEDLSEFINGKLNFEIRGLSSANFKLGFQSGHYADGDQVNNFIEFGLNKTYKLEDTWQSYSIPIEAMYQGAGLNDVTTLLFLRGDSDFDGKGIEIKNIYYSK